MRGNGLVFEDDVVAAEGPAVVAGVEMVAERQNAPGQWVVNAGVLPFVSEWREWDGEGFGFVIRTYTLMWFDTGTRWSVSRAHQ